MYCLKYLVKTYQRGVDVFTPDEVSWAIDVLKDMIAIPTVNPPGINYEKFVNKVSGILKTLDMEIEVIEVPEDIVRTRCSECHGYPRYILIARCGSGKPIIQFNGHYDVVPPGEGWSSPPFTPRLENGKIFGRGAADMKGGIASVFLALRKFMHKHKDFKGTIEVALVPDEEIGGESGTGYLVKTLKEYPHHVIIAEPSGPSNIWIGHKGALWGYVEVFGVQSHGSTPWRGINAFEYMAKIALEFLDMHNRIAQKRESRYDYGDPNGTRPTINIGGEVRGSTKINVVPGYYAFSFDRRIIPEESLELVEKEIRDIVNRMAPAITSENSLTVSMLEKSVEKVLGVKPRKIVCMGGLDMHYYTERGIEAIAYGPGPEENAHRVDEFVFIDEIVAVAAVYVSFLEELLEVVR